MARVLFWNDNMSIKSVKKLVKNVNYMNRLLLQNDQEFLLGKKVGEGSSFKEFGCQVEIKPPTPELPSVETPEQPKKVLEYPKTEVKNTERFS